MAKRQRLPKKGPPCPKCGSSEVIPFIYGLNPDIVEWQKQGKAICGGCDISGWREKQWHCKKCGNDWGEL
jgi:transcription elongation factor Elf1